MFPPRLIRPSRALGRRLDGSGSKSLNGTAPLANASQN